MCVCVCVLGVGKNVFGALRKTRSDGGGQGGEGRVSVVDKRRDKMGEQNHPNLAIDQLGVGGCED